MKMALPLGPYITASLVMLGVPMTDTDALWSLWQVPIACLQSGLRIWEYDPESVNNYSPFEKQLLASCWVLAEIERLTTVSKLPGDLSAHHEPVLS